ncbi:MAG: molybdate transport system substrate-binding protein [Thermoleophilaceae bacterium]|jgi:molybdate transport system substrate-binding protein|nr:molybdate transport system substrate-binding protein [Thermoleophilaceae bacterium]
MKRLAAVALTVAVAGCGGGGSSGSSKTSQPLTVSAAASLKAAFLKYHGGNRYSFAGSDVLAAQIKGGARPDVYAAANTKLPQQLYAAGLLDKPVVFAGNRLVLAIPAKGAKVKSLADLAKPGITIAAGSPSVPVGGYTRQVLARLPKPQSKKILANIRSSEPDVSGVVGKITQAAVDAGFVYATDVKAAGGRLTAVQLPASLQPRVAYAAAVVKGSKLHHKASGFIKGLLTGKGAAALSDAGFDPPPRSSP